MQDITSIFIPVQSSASDLCKAIAAALVANLGWRLDESNPSCAWDSDTHDLGVELKINGSNVYFTIKNAANASTDTTFFTAWNTTTTYYLDFVYSANKTAIAFGTRRSTDTKLRLGVAFDGNNAVISPNSGSWYSVHRGTSNALSFVVTNNRNSRYTSLMLLPSMFGDVFSSVYGIFSCPNTDPNLIYYIGGSYYRIIGINANMYLAFKVG